MTKQITLDHLLHNRNKVNWEFVSKEYRLTNELLDQFKYELNWNIIVQRIMETDKNEVDISKIMWSQVEYFEVDICDCKFTQFIRSYCNQIDWEEFCKIDTDHSTYHFWKAVSKYGILTENFIFENEQNIHWDKLFVFHSDSEVAEVVMNYMNPDDYIYYQDLFNNDVPLEKTMPSMHVIEHFYVIGTFDWSSITCWLLDKDIDWMPWIDIIDHEILSFNGYIEGEYADRIAWSQFWNGFDNFQNDYENIIEFATNNSKLINWSEFCDFCPLSIVIDIINRNYGLASIIDYHIQWNSIKQKVRYSGPTRAYIKEELVQVLYHPKKIHHWISEGNNLEDYLN